MGIIFWICTIGVVSIITGVIFYKPYLGIVFVIISIPFEGSMISGSISIYPLEVILVVLVCICVYKLIARGENYFRNTKLILFYLPFMFCILLSGLKSMEFSLTVKEIVRWTELIVVYFLTINLITDLKKTRIILYSIVLSMVIVSIWGIASYLAVVVGEYKGRYGVCSFFGNPNALAGCVTVIIPVVFGMLMTSAFLWERIALGISTVALIIAWFLSYSMSSWISLALTMSFVLFLTRARKRVALFLAVILIVSAITFLSSSAYSVRNYFMIRTEMQSIQRAIDSRIMCYPIGLNMVQDDLIFGIGVGNYPLLIKKFTKVDAFINNDLHNLYLQLLVEAGIIGLCAFVFFLTGIIKYLICSMKLLEKSMEYNLFVGLLGGVIVYLINNLANVLTVHGIHLQWGIILGIAVVLTQFRESEKCPEMV